MSTPFRLKLESKIILPMVPNFIQAETGTISVGFLTDKQLRQLGREWTAALIAHAKTKRKKPA